MIRVQNAKNALCTLHNGKLSLSISRSEKCCFNEIVKTLYLHFLYCICFIVHLTIPQTGFVLCTINFFSDCYYLFLVHYARNEEMALYTSFRMQIFQNFAKTAFSVNFYSEKVNVTESQRDIIITQFSHLTLRDGMSSLSDINKGEDLIEWNTLRFLQHFPQK